MAKLKIGLVFGGKSREHEVSIKSVKIVLDNLDKEKYEVVPIAITKQGSWLIGEKGHEYMHQNLPLAHQEGGISIEQSQSLVISSGEQDLSNFSAGDFVNQKIDLMFPVGHGEYIEDGRLQGMFEMLGIPYVFSGTLSSALAMDKYKTKLIAKNAGLKVAKEIKLDKKQKSHPEKIVKKLGLPVVVKPVSAGSSVGVNICNDEDDLEGKISKALEKNNEVMLEQFIKGRELTVAVMGNKNPKAMPVIEIIPKVAGFFSYEAKYQQGGSEEICPAEIPEEIRKKVQKYAVKVFKALDCQDLARADFIWSEDDNKLYFLEINTIPGMTATSLAPKAAQAAGMSFPQFLDKLIDLAIKRNKKS